MTINFKVPEIKELKPRILVLGVGGAGGNAINEMIDADSRELNLLLLTLMHKILKQVKQKLGFKLD